jgi:hypothetical protein
MKTFNLVRTAERFFHEGKHFIKIRFCTHKIFRFGRYDWHQANSIDLKTGEFHWFNNSQKVMPESEL